MRSYKRVNLSESNGMLNWLHQTLFSVEASFTINLSFGDLPVNSPVSMAKAPVFVSVP